jgi:hypothetical protein
MSRRRHGAVPAIRGGMITGFPRSAPREPSPGRSDAQLPRVRAVARATGTTTVESRVRTGDLRRALVARADRTGAGPERVERPRRTASGRRATAGAPSLGWPASASTALAAARRSTARWSAVTSVTTARWPAAPAAATATAATA